MRSLFVCIWLAICISLCLPSVLGYTCIHDQIANNVRASRKRDTQPQNYTANDFPTASNTQPIRITLDTSFLANDAGYSCYKVGDKVTQSDTGVAPFGTFTCTQEAILTAANSQYLLNTLLPAALAKLSKAFQVVPVQGNLNLPAGLCYLTGVNRPSKYSAGVPNTDLLVYVVTRPILNSGALAYATGCHNDQYNRAICGVININPGSLSTAAGSYQSQLGTVVHELTHVLGFTSNKFGNQLRNSDNTYFGAMGSINGKNSTFYINTPTVVKFTRDYFDCQTLPGALLEDGGSVSGTQGSHWEKQQWMDEYMTGSSTETPVFSALTLAFFQDSGWYYMNMGYAEQLLWGYKRGCTFNSNGCTGWPTTDGYTCTSGTENVCNFDLTSKGYCGTDTLTGTECPYIRGYSDGYCIDVDLNGKSILNTGEQYSDDSRCFSSSLLKNTPQGSGVARLLCYKTACADSSTLKVKVEDFWYNCPSGGTVSAISYGGTIRCPDPALICGGTSGGVSGTGNQGGPGSTSVSGGSSTESAASKIWPKISVISPDTGLPASSITIFGANFVNITKVYIAGYCTNIQVLSTTKLTAVLPTYSNVENPSNFIKSRANVIVINAYGNNDLAYGIYKLQISLDKSLAEAALEWVQEHWYVPVIAGVALLVIILMCYCCNKKKNKESDNDIYMDQRHR